MHIYNVTDAEFKSYGKILQGYDTAELIEAMEKIPLPECGTDYKASIKELEACKIFEELRSHAYGGMPIQLGMCWGRNTKLNCLEYHRDSEVNIGSSDFILLLAKQEEMDDYTIDTGRVKAFFVPKGLVVEVYATTLHYAPCHIRGRDGFRSAVALPLGTNTALPHFEAKSKEDRLMAACNKWLLAHAEACEAKNGAHIGLVGVNIDIDN